MAGCYPVDGDACYGHGTCGIWRNNLALSCDCPIYTYEPSGDASVWSGEYPTGHSCQYTPESWNKGVTDGLAVVVVIGQILLFIACTLYHKQFRSRALSLKSLGGMGTWLLMLFASLDIIREIIGLSSQWSTDVIDYASPTRDDGGSRAGFFVLTALPNIALVGTCNMAYLFFKKLIRRAYEPTSRPLNWRAIRRIVSPFALTVASGLTGSFYWPLLSSYVFIFMAYWIIFAFVFGQAAWKVRHHVNHPTTSRGGGLASNKTMSGQGSIREAMSPNGQPGHGHGGSSMALAAASSHNLNPSHTNAAHASAKGAWGAPPQTASTTTAPSSAAVAAASGVTSITTKAPAATSSMGHSLPPPSPLRSPGMMSPRRWPTQSRGGAAREATALIWPFAMGIAVICFLQCVTWALPIGAIKENPQLANVGRYILKYWAIINGGLMLRLFWVGHDSLAKSGHATSRRSGKHNGSTGQLLSARGLNSSNGNNNSSLRLQQGGSSVRLQTPPATVTNANAEATLLSKHASAGHALSSHASGGSPSPHMTATAAATPPPVNHDAVTPILANNNTHNNSVDMTHAPMTAALAIQVESGTDGANHSSSNHNNGSSDAPAKYATSSAHTTVAVSSLPTHASSHGGDHSAVTTTATATATANGNVAIVPIEDATIVQPL